MSEDNQTPDDSIPPVDLTDPALDDHDRATIRLLADLAEHPQTPRVARDSVALLQHGVLRQAQRHAAIIQALNELHDLVTTPKPGA